MTAKRKYGVRIARSDNLELDRHPDAPGRQPWRMWAEEQKNEGPIAVDLFSGAGGLSLGLERAGYQVVLSLDHDPAAVRTHQANFPGPCLDPDLSDGDRVDDVIHLLDGLEIDLIAGGPPCQPFSRAGRSKIRDLVDKGIRDAIDPRRELWQVFLRIVEEVKPRAVLLENVPDMALGDDMRTVRYLIDRLEAAGYETDTQIVEAWRYGVPQHRQRLILVAHQSGVFEWPKELEPVTLHDAISDLPKLGDTAGGRELRYGLPTTGFQRLARESVRPDDRVAFELMGTGLRYSELPQGLKRYRDDIFGDKYNRLKWEGYSRSITAHIAKDGYWYIHPEEHRTITVREAARIQTFPDSFRFSGSRSDAFRLIGNAVPPRLGELMATAIRQAAERPTPAPSRRPSQVRSNLRENALKWSVEQTPPAWRRSNDPWAVLVGTIAGRSRSDLADELLTEFPSSESVTGRRLGPKKRWAPNARTRRVLEQLGAAADQLAKTGWHGDDWADAALLGPADALWVEAVGLGRKHVAATAGTIRVAGRVGGDPSASGVHGRMLLAQLVGHSDEAPRITGALAGIAVEVCLPRAARCGICPLSSGCASAGSSSVVG